MTKQERIECKKHGHDLEPTSNPKLLRCKRCGAFVVK